MSASRWYAVALWAPLAALAPLVLIACHESSSKSSLASLTGAPSTGLASAAAPGVSGSFGSASDASAAASTRPVTDAGASAAASASASVHVIPPGEVPPPLLDSDGRALPQTRERPSSSSAAFRHRIELVAQAIISGDPGPAAAAFFPVVAYQQVKDIAKPERDYKFRLLANFKRDVLEYHRALGADAAQVQFDTVTVPEKDARWMDPGSEGNKVGYFRVLRSRLRFTWPSGKNRDFELTSLISWRGEWYVVHLHGFK